MKLLTFLVLFFVAVSSASAQNLCATREEVVERLWNRWQEVLTANGLAINNKLVELFVSEEGSWTIVITDPSGRSCVASAGQGWIPREPRIPPEGT
tara:strand:- start:163 stop:450 length:288 start_codon:yes stop_codon:yes gene_type:complete